MFFTKDKMLYGDSENFAVLYQVLKRVDTKILEQFNNNDLSDDEYFNYGIANDIIANALNVVMNILTDNVESIGVDNSCRIILEALAIKEMNDKKEISDLQKQIYRCSYAYVDADNFKLLDSEWIKNHNLKKYQKDKCKCNSLTKKYFGCDDEGFHWVGVDDPCFYLKKNLKDKIVFKSLIERCFRKEPQMSKAYDFFSIMLHPRYEADAQLEEKTLNKRAKHINYILDMVVKFLTINKVDLNHVGKTFIDDYVNNPLLANNRYLVQQTELTFAVVILKTCKLEEMCDPFATFFLRKTQCLFKDMLIAQSLGYQEHVIVCFKSLVELYSVYYQIRKSDPTEGNYLEIAYLAASQLQLDHTNQGAIKVLQSVFNDYFINKLENKNFDSFCNNCKYKGLYFLSLDKKKRYNQPVNNTLYEIAADENSIKYLKILYKFAKDMGHASGYNFNATPGLINEVSHKVISAAAKLMQHWLTNVSIMLARPVSLDLTNEIRFFEDLTKQELANFLASH